MSRRRRLPVASAVPTMDADQLFLIPAAEPRHQASAAAARVLTFNAQHASPRRARLQAAWIAGQEDADLVVLTEVGSGPGGSALTAALREYGYTSIVAPEPADTDYRTVLASRAAPLIPLSGLDVRPHRAPAATVAIAGTAITLIGLYVPSRGPRERRNEDKRAFQQAVSQALPAFVERAGGGPVIVMGDLNVVEPGHDPHHAVFGSWEYDFYRSFMAAGLTDAFRVLHPDTVEHSWYGRSGRGFRFDHVFVTSPHIIWISGCRYLHQPRQDGLTDHAALAMSLQVPQR